MTNSKILYEQDFNLWREITIQQIRERQFNQVDWEHLLEELEDIGKSEKRAFTPIKCPFTLEQILDDDYYGVNN